MRDGRDLRNKVVVDKHQVYCVGGFNLRGEKYDIMAGKWMPVPPYPLSDNLDSWACALTYTARLT